MKITKIQGLRTGHPTVRFQTVVKNIDGNLIEVQNSPCFDGPTVNIKGGNSDEFWRRHPVNGNKVQMATGAKLLAEYFKQYPNEAVKIGVSAGDIINLKAGKTKLPNHTLHHEHTGNGNDCKIQLVRKIDHQRNPHRGGMLTSNKDRMRKAAETQRTMPKNTFERMCNSVNFNAHKYPATASIIIGAGISSIFCRGYVLAAKTLDVKPNAWGYATCMLIGTAIGIVVHSHLKDGKTYL